MNITFKCPHCGEQVPQGSVFCIYCGSPIASPPSPQPEETPHFSSPEAAEGPTASVEPSGQMYCPQGHQVNDSSSGFCPECGMPLMTSPPVPPVPYIPAVPEEPEKPELPEVPELEVEPETAGTPEAEPAGVPELSVDREVPPMADESSVPELEAPWNPPQPDVPAEPPVMAAPPVPPVPPRPVPPPPPPAPRVPMIRRCNNPACGYVCDDPDLDWCPMCGWKFENPPEPAVAPPPEPPVIPPPVQRRCSNPACGFTTDDPELKWCIRCGHPLTDVGAVPPPPPPPVTPVTRSAPPKISLVRKCRNPQCSFETEDPELTLCPLCGSRIRKGPYIPNPDGRDLEYRRTNE